MATDLSSIAGALKRVYGEYQKQQNLAHKAIDQIGKSLKKMSPGGEGYFGAITDYGNESGGAQTENELFRTIDSEHYLQWSLKPKVITWPIEISGLAAASADSDEEAFVNVLIDALDTAKERMLSDENRQFFGMGTGLLATPTAVVSSLAASFQVSSTQYIRENMVIDIYDAAARTITAARVTGVDRPNNRIVLSAPLGAALTATSEIVKQNIRASAPTDGKEMMGLRGIVDDGTDVATFQTLDVSANRIWRARRVDAGGANLTSDLLQRLCDDVEVLSGDTPDMLITHVKQRRKYLDIVMPQRRYADGSMDAGFSKLTFNGMEMFLDKDCQESTVYALQKKHIQKFELEALGMGKLEGSDTFLRKVNADAFQAYWRHYSNFGTGKRIAHGKIVNLGVPAGVA